MGSNCKTKRGETGIMAILHNRSSLLLQYFKLLPVIRKWLIKQKANVKSGKSLLVTLNILRIIKVRNQNLVLERLEHT